MLTILNRAEVFITRDLDDLNRVRNLLAENQIDHMVPAVTMGFPISGRRMLTNIEFSCISGILIRQKG